MLDNRNELSQKYLESSMRIEEYGVFSYLANRYIDHAENDLFYRESAKAICQNGGKVLQIGFGLGNLSYYIQGEDIELHDIVEDHPDISNHADSLGYDVFKGNPFEFFKRCINSGMQYDAIYCMGISIYDHAFLPIFHEKYLDKILKPGGIYSYRSNNVEGLNINARWKLDTLGYTTNITFIPHKDAANYVNNNVKSWDTESTSPGEYALNWFTKPLNKE